MKNLFTVFALGAVMCGSAFAQNEPQPFNGYYRLTNEAFKEALTVESRYDFNGTVPSPTNAGSIFRIQTGKMASINEAMAELEALLQAGLITQAEYLQRFMALLSSGNTWYYGCFPVEKFESQGVDYVEMINKLPDYADEAIEIFVNNDAETLYKEHRGELQFLCVVASEIINPYDLETVDSFKKWCENYLIQWRNNTIFKVYAQPVYATIEGEGDEDEVGSVFTGQYWFRFHTPPYVGNMQKAQIYINNMLTDNGNITDVETLDLWGSAKHYILEAISADYPEGTPAYEFVYKLFKDTWMDVDYMIAESEDGGIMFQPIPGTFTGWEGYDGPDITLTADDLARSTWNIEKVDAHSPFAIEPNPLMTNGAGEYYSTLYTAFPYQLSSGMRAYYATSVSYDGVPEMVEITSSVIAAETPVIIKSSSADMINNTIIPLIEGGDEIADNVLKGVLFSQKNDGTMVTLSASENSPLFDLYAPQFPANTAYYDGELAKVALTVAGTDEVKVYDLFGREVKDPNAKGIFIVNGKKVVR